MSTVFALAAPLALPVSSACAREFSRTSQGTGARIAVTVAPVTKHRPG